MSEAKFTDGEWRVDIGGFFVQVNSGEDFICETVLGDELCDVTGEPIDGQAEENREAIANMQLIAAAPEMYQMLARIHSEIVENDLEITFDMYKLDLVLSKARGESNENI